MEMSDIISLAERIRSALPNGLNEANTRTSLIMPFLAAMGYDVFNHNEVANEYTAEFGTKKGEKVDIAILRNGEPTILIECKQLGDPLDTGKCSQLYRYFTVKPDARIGILTNGQRYLFFSDIERQNVMDNRPFMEIDLLDFNERLLPELQKFTKDAWDLESALSSAETLKYTRAVKLIVSDEMQEPSDGIIRHYAKQCYDGLITHKVLEMFRPIVKRAFQEHISDLISKRLNSIQEKVENIPIEPKPTDTPRPQPDEKGIITYKNERDAYLIVRHILKDTVSPERVVMRDQKSYCGVLLDNNNRKPICRFYNVVDVEDKEEGIGRNAHIRIMNEDNDGERHNLYSLNDLYQLSDKLKAAVMRHENKSGDSDDNDN